MAKRVFPLSKVYGLLEPGPVVLLTTAHQGKANVMTMSWHTMMEFEPPLVGCVVSNRDFSFDALKATRQCVLNIPTVELAAKVVTGRALDAGPLASARALEGMTAVIVNLNRRYKGHAGLRVTGLP